MTRSLLDAYLGGDARRFFGSHFGTPEDRRDAVRRAARALEPVVADALERQNARFPPSAPRDASLAALREGAAAVVTGQQVGLFLGPLYTLYKAASAIRVAAALQEETGTRVVPVFWLQTEDHDLPEIAECRVPSPEGPLALRVPASAGDRTAIAHRTLPPEVADCTTELRRLLGHVPGAETHLARLERHYRPGAPWVDAFAGLLAELFVHTGLVLLDPRDPALAGLARDVHRRAIVDAEPIAAALLARSRELEEAGFAPSIHVRDGAPLSFLHEHDPAGPRHRLARTAEGFAEIGGHGAWSETALLGLLDAEPLRFSTSALLRPVLQDTLLPTAAYVGGPGEIAYFAQLAPLYAAFGLSMPLVVPRARFRIVERKATRLLERLHLQPGDAALPEDELLARVRTAPERSAESVRAELVETFEKTLRALAPQLESVAPDLKRAVERTRATVERAAGRLASRYDRALLRSDTHLVEDVRRLKDLLQPMGAPQERVYGLPSFAARHGERALVDRVLAAIEPWNPTLKDLHP